MTLAYPKKERVRERMKASRFAFVGLRGLILTCLATIWGCATSHDLLLIIPPGPPPRALEVKQAPVVVIVVQPFKGKNVKYFEAPGHGGYVPTVELEGAMPVAPLLITQAHIDALNYQLRRGDPLSVDLDFPDEVAHGILAGNRGEWVVTVTVYFNDGSKTIQSRETETLRVRNY